MIVFVWDEAKMNERLSELKMWLLPCSYPLAITEEAFFIVNCRDLLLKKGDSYSVYINFDSKSVSIKL